MFFTKWLVLFGGNFEKYLGWLEFKLIGGSKHWEMGPNTLEVGETNSSICDK